MSGGFVCAPKAPQKVLDITDRIVSENKLTTVMITHNMKDVLRLGNRLIMMHDGRIIFDVSGEEKASLTVADLLKKFEQESEGTFANDRMLLA